MSRLRKLPYEEQVSLLSPRTDSGSSSSDAEPLLGGRASSSSDEEPGLELAEEAQRLADQVVIVNRAMGGMLRELSKTTADKAKDHLFNATIGAIGDALSLVVPGAGAVTSLVTRNKGLDIDTSKATYGLRATTKHVVMDQMHHPWRKIPGFTSIEEVGKAMRRANQPEGEKLARDLHYLTKLDHAVQVLEQDLERFEDSVAFSLSSAQVRIPRRKLIMLPKRHRTLSQLVLKYTERKKKLYTALQAALERVTKDDPEREPLLAKRRMDAFSTGGQRSDDNDE